MKFDVIIGNPPYQLNVGNDGGNKSKAKAIYHKFISQAIKLQSHYLLMITPSRWMTKQTEGIEEQWVDEMIGCNHFRVIHDFEDSSLCFPGVSIMGGVNYFLYDKNYLGKCEYYYHIDSVEESISRCDKLDSMNAKIVIRDPKSYSIIQKIVKKERIYYSNEKDNFSGIVSPKDFYTNKELLTSSWKEYSKEKTSINNIKYYLNKQIHGIEYGWVRQMDIPKHATTKGKNKVLIPAANGSLDVVLGQPFYAEPNSVCSQTYLVIGYDSNFSKTECENIISYIRTQFFRYLVSIKKKTQNGPRGVYQFVPLQDFSHPWTDEMLYKKYDLSADEIAFIESMIRPME